MGKLIVGIVFMVVGMCGSFAHAQAGGKAFTQEYVYDFAKQGGAVGQISLVNPANPLPVGAIVTSVHYNVMTAFTSGGSATVAIGDVASGARYLAATAYNNAAYTANTPAAAAIGVPMRVGAANAGQIAITIATAALTAGKMMIVVEGYVPKQ